MSEVCLKMIYAGSSYKEDEILDTKIVKFDN